MHPLAGTSFGCGILQPGVETEQGVTSVGSHWHTAHTEHVPGLRAGLVLPLCLCLWIWLLPLSLVSVDLVLPLSLVFVDLAATLPHSCDSFQFPSEVPEPLRGAVLAFLLRNVDLFGWILDRQMESCASEPTVRNIARSSCHC